MSVVSDKNLVLTVYPFSRGFAFVLFEGPDSPFDWGVKEIRDKQRNIKTLDEIKDLIDRYCPEAMVIENVSDRAGRRSSRIKKLYQMINHLAVTEHLDLHRISNADIKKHFAVVGATTKYEIAKAIGRQIPAFGHRLPRVRKPWMSADPRQSLFDAAALGLVFYWSRGIPSPFDAD